MRKKKALDYSQYLVVRSSPKHGRGVFTTREIPRGARIIEYVGRRVPVKKSDAIAERQMQRASKNGTGYVYLFSLNKKYDIDGNVRYNRARLINHACAPNCEVEIIRGRIWIIAKRRIRSGEELTYDYGFNLDSWQDHPCRCGSANCLGYIVSASRRGVLARILKRAKGAIEHEKTLPVISSSQSGSSQGDFDG